MIGAADHGREGDLWRYMRRRQAGRIVGPGLGQVQRPIDEGVAVPGHVGGKDPDLAVGDLAGRARVLARHAAGGLALLEKAGLVQNQHGILVGQALDHVVAHHIAERVGLPATAAEDRLLPPFSPLCGLSLRGIAFGDGPGSPAASARIQPVLRRSGPSRPSRNRPAETATRSCVNSGRIRRFTSRSEQAHNASASSTATPATRDLRTVPTQQIRNRSKMQL